MKSLAQFFRTRKTALIISSVYVGAGTLAVYSLYPDDPTFGEWSLYIIIGTFPVTFISFMYRYVEADAFFGVLMIQFIMFIITFFVLSLFIRNKYEN